MLRLYQLATVIGVAVLADGIVLLALHGPELRQLWAVEMVVLVPLWARGMRNARRCMRLTRRHTTA